MKKALLRILGVFCLVCITPCSQAKNNYLTLEETLLQLSKERLQNKDADMLVPYAELLKSADALCKMPSPSVMDKKHLPPSGDKHDYMSLSRYWWPNPKKNTGLPYIRKDGQSNPELEEYDRPALQTLIDGVRTLPVAYFLSGKEKYAAKLVDMLETWFLNVNSKMNPHLKYGQAIKGRTEGRGIGIIDTRNFAFVPDAIQLIKTSKSYSPKLENEIKAWMALYVEWLWTSKHGKDERATTNNHGTAYDYQVACLAAFVGRNDIVDEVLKQVPQKRIFPQINADGSQPRELKRTRSYSYSIFNLDNFMMLAVAAHKLGYDLLNAQGPEGQSLRKAIEFLAPYLEGRKKWTFQQITPFEDMNEPAYRLVSIASYYSSDNELAKLARRIAPEKNQQYKSNLIFPLDK